MNRLLLAGVLLAGSLAGMEAQAPGRTISFGVGAGASVPTGDLGDATGTGLNALGIVALRVAALPVAVQADFLYQRFGLNEAALADVDDPLAEGHVRSLAGTLALVYTLPVHGALSAYLSGGGGIYDVKVAIEERGGTGRSASQVSRNLGVNGGAGLRLARGPIRVFLEARFHSVATDGDDTTFIPISAGVMF